MEIPLYLGICLAARYLEISVCLEVQHMARYGWRNGAKFTKFIFIHIQRFNYHSRIYLSTFNN